MSLVTEGGHAAARGTRHGRPRLRVRRPVVGLLTAALLLGSAACQDEPRDDPRDNDRATPDVGNGNGNDRASTDPQTGETNDERVRLTAGSDLQSVVEQHPPGTAFLLEAGLHRRQTIEPRDGDTFVGEDGAVMNGAKDVDGFTEEGGQWWAAWDEPPHGPIEGQALPGREIVKRFEELFVGDDRLLRVASRGELGPGRWFLDDAAGRVWVGQDPGDAPVQVSVTPWAFRAEGSSDVTIDNVRVERYANRSQRGAVNPDNSLRWTIRSVTAAQNHGPGIGMGPGVTIENVDIVDNGQIGLAGRCDLREGDQTGLEAPPSVVRDSRIRENGGTGFDWEWEGGGLKIAICNNGITFENNWVHDNVGPGIWLDIDNVDAKVLRNRSERNSVAGIFYEISAGQTLIEHNITLDNGGDPEPVGLDGGIVVANSFDVTVRDNITVGSPVGVLVRHSDRGVSPLIGERVTDRVVIEDNRIAFTATTGIEALREPERVRGEFDIRFADNTYALPSLDEQLFRYVDEDLTVDGWQARGFDTGSTFEVGDGADWSFEDGVGFARQPSYGAVGTDGQGGEDG